MKKRIVSLIFVILMIFVMVTTVSLDMNDNDRGYIPENSESEVAFSAALMGSLPPAHMAIWPPSEDYAFHAFPWWGVGTIYGIVNDVIFAQGNPDYNWQTGVDLMIAAWNLQSGDLLQITVEIPTGGLSTEIEITHNIGRQWQQPGDHVYENWVPVLGGEPRLLAAGESHVFTITVGQGFAPHNSLRVRRTYASYGRDFYITDIFASRPSEDEVDLPPPPIFSHSAGFFAAPFNLTLSPAVDSEPSTVIRFTTDGSIPTLSSPAFTAPIPIYAPNPAANSPMSENAVGWNYEWGWQGITWNGSQTNWNNTFRPRPFYNGMVVRARAFDSSGLGSETVTQSFFVDAGIFENTRILSLTMEPHQFIDETVGLYRNWGPRRNSPDDYPIPPLVPWPTTGMPWEVSEWEGTRQIVSVEMFVDGERIVSQNARAWVLGQWSRRHAKRSIRINFNQGDGDIRNLPNFIPYTRRNFYDPNTYLRHFRHINARLDDPHSTDLRDSVAHLISEPLRPTIQNSVHGAVFVNGEFWGMYDFRAHRHEHLLGQMFGISRSDIWMNNNYEHWTNAYRIAAILRNSGNDFDYFATRVCMDDLIDMLIIGFHFGNWDWPSNNFEFWRSTEVIPGVHGADGKYRFIMQDFDTVMGSSPGTNHYYENMLSDFTLVIQPGQEDEWRRPPWVAQFFNTLFANPDFRNTFAARYSTYAGTVFSPVRSNYILESMVRERLPFVGIDAYRWHLHGATNQANGVANWQSQVDTLRTFMERRPAHAIEHIREHLNRTNIPGLNLGLPDGLTNITWEINSDMGFLDISGAQIRADLFQRHGQHGFSVDRFSADYIQGLPIIVTAVPFEGYVFSNFVVTGATYEVLSHNQIRITPTGDAPVSVAAIIATDEGPLGTTITITNVHARPGQNVSVRVNIANNPGFGSMMMRFNFPDALTLMGIETHTELEGFFHFSPEHIPVNISETAIMGWTGKTGTTGNFHQNCTLLTLTFAVANDAPPGLHAISASFENARGSEFPANYAGQRLDMRILGGGVTVHTDCVCVGYCRLGDINGDGRITSQDASWLARWLINPSVPICIYAADFYGDGNIYPAHVTLLAKWLMGHEVSIDRRN